MDAQIQNTKPVRRQMALGMYNDKFWLDKTRVVTKTYPTTIRSPYVPRQTVEMTVVAGPLCFTDYVLDKTFLLTIDYSVAERLYNRALPLDGFGSMSCFKFMEAADEIADKFAAEQGWRVHDAINHWPKLQFICEIPSPPPKKPKKDNWYSRG